MNNELAQLGLPTWVEVPPCERTAQALNQWLPVAFKEKMPLLEELITSLGGISARENVPEVTLDPTEILSTVECAWQNRILAVAQPIPHYMGSFGPAAYNVSHLESAGTNLSGITEPTWTELRQQNDSAAAGSYTLFDNFHGGCGGSVAAIKAGWFVQSGTDCAAEEVRHFESLTGRVSLGDVDIIDNNRVPRVHCWFSCSSCKDFSQLGGKAGIKGSKGGCHFIHQFEAAAAAGAKVVVIENVDGVATIDGGVALILLERNAKAVGYSRFFHKRITFSQYGDPENRSRRVIVAFHDSVQLQRQWTWPGAFDAEWSLEHSHRKCAGEVMQPSTMVPARFWDDRPCHEVNASWRKAVKQKDNRIFTLGYKDKYNKIGTPPKPSHVWLPTGLFPTCLASGNSGLVRTIFLRAMCPLYSRFSIWFDVTHSRKARSRRKKVGIKISQKVPARKLQKGRIRERRPMPSEVLQSKGFPNTTPVKSDATGFRFAGNAVPVSWFTVLLGEVRLQLEDAGVCKAMVPKDNQYVTWMEQPLHTHDRDLTAEKYGGGKTKKGHNLVHNVNREKVSLIPVSVKEWEIISEQGVYFKDGRYADTSKVQINRAWNHWRSFCIRFNRPLFLKIDTRVEKVAAFQQAKLFLQYEVGLFKQKAESVAQKIWAVGAKHKAEYLEDPFVNNQLLRDAIADAVALDDPVKPKIPVSNETLQALQQRLSLTDRKGFVLWIAVKFAITYLCRISEYAVDGAHAVLWKHLIFYTSSEAEGGRQPLKIKSVADVYRAAELQVIFYSDKTNPRGNKAVGQGKARSFFSIRDLKNTDCIVRDMARLWLISERFSSYKVFSWAADTQGVTRQLVSDMLKEAAIATGIPGADVSTHSLRRTGLSRLVAKGPLNPNPMPWEIAREYGRWKSDCARRYFWASSELAQNYATAIWASPRFVQVRGKGEVKVMTH
jgi:site-specific DNA-cytosine methylase